jgi:methanogenic corrinoid protein MtbC1
MAQSLEQQPTREQRTLRSVESSGAPMTNWLSGDDGAPARRTFLVQDPATASETTVSEPQPFAASLLRASAEGLAGMIAARLHEEAPLEAVHEAGDFASWKRHIEQHLYQLAAAVADGLPGGFADQVAWSRDAFAARGQSAAPLESLVAIARDTLHGSLPADTHPAIDACYDAAEAALGCATPAGPTYIDPHTPGGELATRYGAALRDGNEAAALQVVLSELDAGRMTPQQAVHEVLVPTLRELGREWHLNRLSIAEEHFATAVTQKLLARVLAQNPLAEPNGKTVLLTAVAGNCHGFGIQIIAAEFELDGWRTLHLGTDMPAEDIADMAKQFEVDLVGIGATLDTQRQAVQACVQALRAARPEQKILVGGQAFSDAKEAWKLCGADAFASSAREAVQEGRRLVGLP